MPSLAYRSLLTNVGTTTPFWPLSALRSESVNLAPAYAIERVALLPAATDWLDGLNKELSDWDRQYYMGEFRALCQKDKMNTLDWPNREYCIQIARFDPAKGIPNVIDSYARFRRLLNEAGDVDSDDQPQLLICGHGAVDDPDASIIYDQVLTLIHEKYAEFAKDIVVMRLPPSDQRKLIIRG